VPVYTDADALLLGDIPLPQYLDAAGYISDATDEIDSHIGFVYQTPVDVSDTSTVVRPARLLLRRICTMLASGRILLAISTPTEDTQANAYGLYLVKEATDALHKIAEGQITLDGAALVGGGTVPSTGPMQYNEDAVSAVDTFYGGLTSPDGIVNPARGLSTAYFPRSGG
jgi:hypothetical protein